jgi:hypothetical protein
MKWLLIVPGVLILLAALTALEAWVIELLWNWLMPAIFGLPHITFWMALGIIVLVDLLFGGVTAASD